MSFDHVLSVLSSLKIVLLDVHYRTVGAFTQIIPGFGVSGRVGNTTRG